MSDRTCSTVRCMNTKAPHRARTGAGYWCNSCLDHWGRVGTDPANRQALRPVPDACPVVEDGTPCGRPVAVKHNGWCQMHRKLAQNNGSPTTRKRSGRGTLQDLVREAAQATGDDCIIPPGWTIRPMVKVDGVLTTAARAVWTLAHGDPGESHVLHTCHEGDGTVGCVSVRHLYLGDNADNTRDRVEAERQARGEGHGGHILTEDEVRDIRRRHVPGTGPYNRGNSRDLAEEFRVAVTTIRNAVAGRSWSHMGKDSPGDGTV